MFNEAELQKVEPNEFFAAIKAAKEAGYRVAYGCAGRSPYSPNYYVIVAADHNVGDRVNVRPVAQTFKMREDGYKGRGAAYYAFALQRCPDGEYVVCQRDDRGSVECPSTGVYLHTAEESAQSAATGGMGQALAAIMADIIVAPPKVVVVTRHPALVEVLKEDGVIPEDATALEHATADQVAGCKVYGVLPIHLAAVADSLTSVDMDVPPEMRGQELAAAQVRQYMTGITTYRVQVV